MACSGPSRLQPQDFQMFMRHLDCAAQGIDGPLIGRQALVQLDHRRICRRAATLQKSLSCLFVTFDQGLVRDDGKIQAFGGGHVVGGPFGVGVDAS